ncbi:unnamed protein product [Brachionus calyciflorus]|uniref:Cystatin domain-containing protein n=1 Tax=Brachionus calyciflorus TaxID=104777 RepID=A0A813TDB5_9BILA|nr:unnamed protein product [Brachionus calyciflorus]
MPNQLITPIVCGGLNETHPANDYIQDLLNNLEHEIRTSSDRDFEFLKAIEFRSQVVAGRNFFIKANVGKEHIHVKIFVPLPINGDKPLLTDIKFGKTETDEITYF